MGFRWGLLLILAFLSDAQASESCIQYLSNKEIKISVSEIQAHVQYQKQQTPQQKAQDTFEMLEVLAEHDVYAGYRHIDNVISETLNKVTQYLKKNPYFEQLDSETSQTLEAVQQIDSKFKNATQRNWWRSKRIPTSEDIESILRLENKLVAFEENYHKQLNILELYELDLIGILGILRYEKDYLEILQNLLKKSTNKNLNAFIVPLVSKISIVLSQKTLVESLQESTKPLLSTIQKLHDQVQTLLHNRFPMLAQLRQSLRTSSIKNIENEAQTIRVYDQNFDFRMTDQELLDAAKWSLELQKIIDNTLSSETRNQILEMQRQNESWHTKVRYLRTPNLIAILAFHFRENHIHNNLQSWTSTINPPLRVYESGAKSIDDNFQEQLNSHSSKLSKEKIEFLDSYTNYNVKILIYDLTLLLNNPTNLSIFQKPEQVILTYKMIMNLMLGYLHGSKDSHKFAVLSITHQLLLKVFNLSLPPLDSAIYQNYVPPYIRLTLQDPDTNYYRTFNSEEIQTLNAFEYNLNKNANTLLPEAVIQLSVLKESPGKISEFMVKYGLRLKHPSSSYVQPSLSQLDLLPFLYLTLKIMRESDFYKVILGESKSNISEGTYSETSVDQIKFMMERYGSAIRQYPVQMTNTDSILIGTLFVLKKEDPQIMNVSHAEKLVFYKVYMSLLEHHLQKSSFFVEYVRIMRKLAHTTLMRKLDLSDEDVHSSPVSSEFK